MAPYGLLTAVLDFIGLASTVTVVVWLASGLQPLFKRVRDSCRACQPPEERTLLLRTIFLVQVTWLAAATLYFRILFSFWNFMGTWLEDQPTNKPVYALLHLYLFFLLIFGGYALSITVLEISQSRKVFKDFFMIVRFNERRYQVIEDLETQRGSSFPCPIDAGVETSSVVGNVPNANSLSQDESPGRNDQESDEDVAPAKARINEAAHPTEEEAAWPGSYIFDGEVIRRSVHSPIRIVKRSSSPLGCGRSNREAAGPSFQHHLAFDSDGDGLIITPSNDSSGIDEPENVNDDRCNHKAVRLREPLEGRKQRNSNASNSIDQRRYVKTKVGNDDDDDDQFGLYYATPRLSPQDQNGRTDFEPLNIGDPHSPCGSCSSAHAESIPTAQPSPVRVPITPTSPTAYSDDADTEKTDVERKQRERKHRTSAMSAPQSPHANTSRRTPPYDPNMFFLGVDPFTVSSDGQIMVDKKTGMRRRVHPSMSVRPRQRKRPGSPYPFAERRQATGPGGGRGQKGLSVEIPDAGFGAHRGEGGK